MATLAVPIDDGLAGAVALAGAGDETAFARIIRAYHDDMTRVCFVICGDLDVADEAVQAAWPIAWRKLGSLRDPDRLRPWLVSIAANEARQLIRRRRRRTVVELAMVGSIIPGVDPAGHVGDLDLANALARLDPDDRALLALRWSLLYLVRLGHKNLNLVFGGSYDGAFGLLGPIDFGASLADDAAAFKLEWEKKGAIVAAGGDCMMGPIGGQGGGGSGLWENFTCFDSHDRASTEGTLEFFTAVSRDFMAKRGLGVGMENWNAAARGSDGYATPKAERDAMHLATPQPDVWRYQARIREALNPNNLGDAYYETLEDA